MNHNKIPALQTDEAIVEAVNRHLNSNVGQVNPSSMTDEHA